MGDFFNDFNNYNNFLIIKVIILNIYCIFASAKYNKRQGRVFIKSHLILILI